MRTKVWYIIFLVAALYRCGMGFSPVFGQQYMGADWRFEQLSVREGLSQSSVLSIHQDQFGFMWIGTRDGLNKYDGYSFEVFRHLVNDSTSIAGNIIYGIKEDAAGHIWVVTENGLSKYDRKWNVFNNYSLPKEEYETSALQVLWIDQSGEVWVGGRHGLFLFDRENFRFHTDFIKGQEATEEPMNLVSAITEDAHGNVWVGTTRFGIFRINRKKGIYERIPADFIGNRNNSRVEALVVDKQGRLWVGTYGNGLFLMDAKGSMIHRYGRHAATPSQLSHNNIRALEMDSRDRLWVGTFDGLDIIDGDRVVKHISYQEGNEKGLSHGSIRAILKDQKGTLWIGTYFGGINLFDEDNQRFRHYYHMPFNRTSLSYNVVGAFADTESGDFIIGTERGGINIFQRASAAHVQKVKPNGTIKSLLRDSYGQVWVGVFREGLSLLNQHTGTLIAYPSSGQPGYQELHDAIINCMVEDVNGGIWLGTDSKGGLFYFNTIKKRFEHFYGQDTIQDFLGNYPVKSIHITNGEHIFIATKGKGIVVFNRRTAEISQHDKLMVDGNPVIVDEFNHVYKDRSGLLWFASNGAGVFSYSPKTAEINRFHAGDGLANNIVLGTMEDEAGNLWFVTLNGLTRRHPITHKEIRNYQFSSGFPLEEINEGAFFKTADGEFLIGGSNGYIIMDPLGLKDNTYVPPVVLTTLSISNRPVYPGDPTGILEQELHNTASITLNHTQSILTLDFAALNFIRPENNQYAYKLEGFDDDWIYSHNRRSATYTSLPDGRYTFMVKGSNNDAVWNEIPLELEIIVLPPPWRSWWAYCIYGILIVAGFLIIRYNAIKSTQLKHNLRVEQLETEKWKEIHDLKLTYFIDVSHEFRTPLTLILSPLEEIIGSKIGNDWLRSRLKIMLFNAKRLLHLIDQILEIRELEAGHHVVQHKQVFLSSMMSEIVDSFKALADKQQIKLRYMEKNLPEIPLMIDRDKMEKIFFNLLSNAFKFTPEGGEIVVKTHCQQDIYYFEVKDTGQGIMEKDVSKVFDRFYKKGKNNYGAGIGLSITKLLVEVMGGTIHVKSKPGLGTAFYIGLPFQPSTESLMEPYTQGNFQKPVPLEYQDTVLVDGKEAEKGPQEKEIVLVAEDNQSLRNYLVNQLSTEYEVVTANDGKKALKKAKKIGPSLIVSDVMMPEMDGFELCQELKSTQELCHIPIILLTAKNSSIHKLEGLEKGADDYIGKPFSILELKARMRNILQNRKMLHEKYRTTSFLPDAREVAFNSYDERLLAKLQQTLTDNLDQSNLTVEYLGDQVGLSRVHLFRKLKALTGMSPSDFIKDFRMKHARQMLETGKFRVVDVAESVGFQDVQYFSKVFKKETGKSPSEFSKE